VSRTGETLTLTLVGAAAGIAFVVRDHMHTPFDPAFERAGAEHAIDPNLLRGFARVESSFKADAVNVNANGTRDLGLMQINERTAAALNVPADRLFDPEVAIATAARLIKSLRIELGEKLSLHSLIAAYNAGSPSVIRRGITNTLYVSNVLYHTELYALGRMFA